MACTIRLISNCIDCDLNCNVNVKCYFIVELFSCARRYNLSRLTWRMKEMKAYTWESAGLSNRASQYTEAFLAPSRTVASTGKPISKRPTSGSC